MKNQAESQLVPEYPENTAPRANRAGFKDTENPRIDKYRADPEYSAVTDPMANLKVSNTTLGENVDRLISFHRDEIILLESLKTKIAFHHEEIIRLDAMKVKVGSLLDVNLRDLRKAMEL